jgi:TrmH family RNA methyltransferase
MDVSTLIPVGLHSPWIQQYLSLKQTNNARQEDAVHLASLEGAWMLTQALQANLKFHSFFVCPDLLRNQTARSLAEKIIASAAPSYVVSERVMRKLVDWEGPDGIAAIVHLPRFGWNDIRLSANNGLVVLDGVTLPGNIGTIIRCADGAGLDGIIVTNCKKRLSHPRLLHASMGSAFTFPVIEADTLEAITWLKRHRFKIVTTDTAASLNYREANYQGRVAVVMGNERHGISQLWRDAHDLSVSIPMNGSADSLNVGNAAVLMLYEVFYQQRRVG